MSNTTAVKGNFVTITGLDANWTLATDMPGFATSGLRVKSIEFNPGAASDTITVRNVGASSATVFKVSCTDANDQKVKYFDGPGGIGQQMWPYIKIADASLSSAALCDLKIELA